MPTIQAPADNGNIIALETSDPANIHVKIREDNNRPEHFEWFNFTLQGEKGQPHVVYIDNAGKVSFPDWEYEGHYEVYASYNKNDWFHLPTTYDAENGQLCITVDSLEQDEIQFAFFPAYNYARHLELIDIAHNTEHCEVTHLGKTTFEKGRDITLLTFGTPAAEKKEIWLIARQHPGEPQSEWYAEQLVLSLAEKDASFFEKFTVRLVPNMNPDGTYLGNLRTNGNGIDLNRQWREPSAETCPEVYLVLEKMKETGVDFFMDIHSDEAASEVFFPDLIPGGSETRPFVELYKKQNSQIGSLNYDAESGLECPPMESTLDIAEGRIGALFNCPAFTLEMPIKNWSIDKCYGLAREFFVVLDELYAAPDLKQEEKRSATPPPPTSPGSNSMFHKEEEKDDGVQVDTSQSMPPSGCCHIL